MRKSALVSVVLHTLLAVAALLWLLWYFIPMGNLLKVGITLLVLGWAGWIVWKNTGRHPVQANGEVADIDLPLLETQGPVVLVCGDGLDELFQQQSLRKTAQGWWIRVDNTDALGEWMRTLLEQQPRQAGQLSVMYACQPDQHQDEAVLRGAVKALRHQVFQAGKLAGFDLPVVLSCEFSGPETPWVVVRGDKPVIYPEDQTPLALDDWQQAGDNLGKLSILGQAFAFIQATLTDELVKTDRLSPAIQPFAVAFRTRAMPVTTQTLWSHWLWRRTCLRLPAGAQPAMPSRRFPDAVLPLLAPFAVSLQGGQRTRRLVLLIGLCALAALGFSANNNRGLITQVSTDLQRWYAIPMTHYEPKAQSLDALKQDVLLLERWQRQGEPMRFSLGYYPGQRLWLALQQAIDTYVPPSTPQTEAEPKIVRLDSLSLFDSGKAVLKPDSTKMLVNSLVGIKARPGWLIVVSGHTDNTGNAKQNQLLSLQRAEAVRNWMRDTGDVPESCFAVQGYGDSRPLAPNDTDAGRAQNRRVEISLVPQADACQVPGNHPPSSLDGDGTQH
ncbi:OmpA family protein [Serratia sp. DD3]|uniref:OmpA family protein n=1 Tax=Serratia sp. DD3 TaxID=1410619 RepID=UPI0004D7D321|nr:OmpA family protein [Serratia sp. DD3]KEY60951.1 outer membrane porin F [Serratia sp. DD3]